MNKQIIEKNEDIRIIMYKEGEILIFSDDLILVKNFKQDVLYLYKTYFVDNFKNLYKIIEDNPVKICQLKKRVSKIVEYNNNIFILDVFGDVYKLEEDKLIFIFGSLCSIKDIHIFNDKFYILDKYQRLRICQQDGKILNYEFGIKENLITTLDNKIKYMRDNDLEHEKIKNNIIFENYKIFIGEKFLHIFDSQKYQKISNNIEYGNINFGTNGLCYGLENEKLILLTKK
ncbi:WD40 repeat domain-containing protein [Vairimorpha necatrix]|uniref:WD40 repeat domain-containing protein n=1 Tax=Vairimorpha necatrix TaxID=6039 RepID=A0AAX4JG94_9MICR